MQELEEEEAVVDVSRVKEVGRERLAEEVVLRERLNVVEDN